MAEQSPETSHTPFLIPEISKLHEMCALNFSLQRSPWMHYAGMRNLVVCLTCMFMHLGFQGVTSTGFTILLAGSRVCMCSERLLSSGSASQHHSSMEQQNPRQPATCMAVHRCYLWTWASRAGRARCRPANGCTSG